MLDYICKENLLELHDNLITALCLQLTLLMTVASEERSFSTLKQIKAYLRSTMSQERLNGLAVFFVEQRLRGSLNMEDIIYSRILLKPKPEQFNSAERTRFFEENVIYMLFFLDYIFILFIKIFISFRRKVFCSFSKTKA